MPWWRAWPETLSSIARGRACTRTPSRLASSANAVMRGLCVPCSTRISRTRDGSFANAPSTGLMPTIQVSLIPPPPPSVERGSRGVRGDVRRSLPPRRTGGRRAFVTHHPEIDLAILHAGAQDLHAHRVAEAENRPGAFAAQLVAARIELVVVVAQLGDVHQPRNLR